MVFCFCRIGSCWGIWSNGCWLAIFFSPVSIGFNCLLFLIDSYFEHVYCILKCWNWWWKTSTRTNLALMLGSLTVILLNYSLVCVWFVCVCVCVYVSVVNLGNKMSRMVFWFCWKTRKQSSNWRTYWKRCGYIWY